MENSLSTPLDFAAIGEGLKSAYRKAAARYRCDDEVEVETPHHLHLHNVLGTLCASFGRPINVLDVGCGTGRYFHCLTHVERLIGIDLSEEMLKVAANPVRKSGITVRNIELRCENAHLCSFFPESFDFIYSLGMFGNGCPVTVEILNKFHDWLTPDGHVFFNTVDLSALPFGRRVRRHIRNRIYPWLPKRAKATLDQRAGQVPFYGMTRRELEKVMRASRLSTFTVTSHICQSPLWQGRHLECAACKIQCAELL